MSEPKPFLRWAGGKRQLLPIIHASLPKDFSIQENRFFEPFLGGGAMMFSLCGLFGFPSSSGQIIVNDVNPDLTNVYETLKSDCETLILLLREHASKNSEDFFYSIRGSVPDSPVERAARMIYLNRTCFNGLYRVNRAGEFNVPWGKLRNPKICDDQLLRDVSNWLKKVQIRNGGFAAAVEDSREGDVVYFDPPYLPLSPTSKFSRYAIDDFLTLDHYALAGVIHGLAERGVHVILSNSNTQLTRTIYAPEINLRKLNVTRTISAKTSSRGSVEEVLGLTFPVKNCRNPKLIYGLERITES
jgi:DNA adenine methylase